MPLKPGLFQRICVGIISSSLRTFLALFPKWCMFPSLIFGCKKFHRPSAIHGTHDPIITRTASRPFRVRGRTTFNDAQSLPIFTFLCTLAPLGTLCTVLNLLFPYRNEEDTPPLGTSSLPFYDTLYLLAVYVNLLWYTLPPFGLR